MVVGKAESIDMSKGDYCGVMLQVIDMLLFLSLLYKYLYNFFLHNLYLFFNCISFFMYNNFTNIPI